MFVIEVALEEALSYESEFKKKEPVFNLAREKGSFIEAVKEIAAEMRSRQYKKS